MSVLAAKFLVSCVSHRIFRRSLQLTENTDRVFVFFERKANKNTSEEEQTKSHTQGCSATLRLDKAAAQGLEWRVSGLR